MSALPQWDGDVASALAQQAILARQLRIRDGFPQPLRTVAGVATDSPDQSGVVRASVAVLDAESLSAVASGVAEATVHTAPVTGLRSFREMPCILEALSTLPKPPDLILVQGHGIDHPAGLGMAAHLGMLTNLPTIGVATSVLVGTFKPLHEMRGAFAPVRREDGRQIGWVLRSKVGAEALTVSPGHRVSMAAAPELVMRFTRADRLPEPIRIAKSLLA